MLTPGNYDSVFSDLDTNESEFDTMFGGEEDDELMDVVGGFTESGDPMHLPEEDELHHNEDDAKVSSFGDELGPNHDSKNKPTADEAMKQRSYGKESDYAHKLADGGESEAGRWYNDEDDAYQSGKSDRFRQDDPENLMKASDTAMSEMVDDIFDEFGDPDFDDDDIDDDMGFDEAGDPDETEGVDEGCGKKCGGGNSGLDDTEGINEEDNVGDDPEDGMGGDENVDESFFWEADSEDDEDALIAAAEKDDGGPSNKDLSYDSDDEELIDMVADGD